MNIASSKNGEMKIFHWLDRANRCDLKSMSTEQKRRAPRLATYGLD